MIRTGRPGTRREGGFTLIEMLVVIGIIVLMLSLGAVTLFQFLRTQKTKLALGQVSSLIRMARQFAVSKRRRCWVEFKKKSGSTPAKAILYSAEGIPDADTGRLSWAISVTDPLKTMEMPPEVDFVLVPGNSAIPERTLGTIDRPCFVVYGDGTCEATEPEDSEVPACYDDNPAVTQDPADGTSVEEFKVTYRYKLVLQNTQDGDIGIIFVPPRTVSMREKYLTYDEVLTTLVDPDGSGSELFPPH